MNLDISSIISYLFTIFTIFWILGMLRRAITETFFPNNIETLTIDGVIYFDSSKSGKFRQWIGALTALSQRKKPPKALIIRINSPGGTVAATQELFSAINKVKSKGVKVIAMLEDVAASGGLYIAMAADYIVSNPGTTTGSIGVIIHGFDYSKILDWLQVKDRSIKSGQFKDILSPTREMTDPERALLQEVVSDTHEQFVLAVASARGLTKEQVSTFADGRIFNGNQAKSLKVVDELGGFDAAVEAAKRLAEIPKGKERVGAIDIKEEQRSLFNILSGSKILGNFFNDLQFQGAPLYLMRS